MRFELLAVFDFTDSPTKYHPAQGPYWPHPPKANLMGLGTLAFRIGVASRPAMVANNKRVQVAIVKNGLDIAGLNARA